MKGLIAFLLLTVSVCAGGADNAYVLVVDRDGQPVGNVSMIFSMHDVIDSPAIKERLNDRILVQSDSAGRVELKLAANGGGTLVSMWKEGYKLEDFLNPSLQYLTVTRKSTFQNPCKYVLRKLEDERTCMLNPMGVKDHTRWWNEGCNYYFSKENGRRRLNIDFFRKVSEAKAEWNHLRYTDFSVEPHFDSISKQWSFTLMTTNSGCGIIATTNRVFMAPKDGYGQRVDVSPELYTHPCFTLYLCTRTPRVYAMIPFAPGGYFGIKGYAGDDVEPPYFKFGFGDLLINPTGGRTFDEDDSLDETVLGGSVGDTIRSDAWRDFLFEHRYPRPPDVPARIKNRKAKKVLDKENQELEEKLWHLEKQIKEVKSRMNGSTEAQMAEATKELQAEKKRIDERLTSNGRECARLDKEVYTLFLEAK